MSENPLVHVLTQSIQAGSLSDTLRHLSICSNLLATNQNALLDLKVTNLLNRLHSKYSSQIASPLARIYLSLSKISQNSEPVIILKVCNDILMLCEHLKNTEIADELSESTQKLLKLLASTDLEEAQKEVVESLIIKKNYSQIKEKFDQIIADLEEFKISGMHLLFDVFSSLDSFKEQIDLYVNFLGPVISVVQKVGQVEIVKKLLLFLEHFVFRFNYGVQIGEFTELYCVTQKLPKSVIPSTLQIINVILAYDISITQDLLTTLQRLWALFPEESESFEDATRLVLSAIALQGTADFKVKASGFLYEILSTPGISQSFKSALESTDSLSSLLHNEAFGPSSTILESDQTSSLELLQPIIGLPLNTFISAGEEFYYCVEILEANSIITWGFATESYDINFEIIRIDLPVPQVLTRQEKVQCNSAPYIGSKLISSPGLYKFIWTNKHSWFTSKHIRFRISVLIPYHKVTNNEKDLHKVIEILCDDGVSPNSKEVLEVAIVCKGRQAVLISALGLEEELPDLDILAVQDFISRVKADNRFISTKIGIVAKVPKKRMEFKQLQSVAMCRDVDAVALLNESEIHCEMLICVMQDDGVRSCAVYHGKVMVDAEGTPIADLHRAGVTDIYVGISTLLCLLGPAVVILCGNECPSLKEVISRVKDLVPKEIFNESAIRCTVYGPQAVAIAASKLHQLNHKFRINS